ncbi:hypothetical protein VTO42DRAFT_3685 [Malbranchea cinnamomea]
MAPKYPLSISGYTVFPVEYPPTPSFPQAVKHFLYIQPHEPRIPDPDSPRSLFIVNVPITATEVHLRHLFGAQLSAGRVERVEFYDAPQQKKKAVAPIQGKPNAHKSKKRKRETAEDIEAEIESSFTLPPVWDRDLQTSGSHAVVVFVDRASMEASLKAAKAAAKSMKRIVWGDGIESRIPALGIQRYQTHQAMQYPAKSELLQAVNDYMTLFSRLEEARAREAAKATHEPDEDGFITVRRGPKNPVVKEEEMQALLEKHKEKTKGLEDFYRFQMREKRKERQEELLRKFEEDKKKVEEMKARRGKVVPE